MDNYKCPKVNELNQANKKIKRLELQLLESTNEAVSLTLKCNNLETVLHILTRPSWKENIVRVSNIDRWIHRVDEGTGLTGERDPRYFPSVGVCPCSGTGEITVEEAIVGLLHKSGGSWESFGVDYDTIPIFGTRRIYDGDNTNLTLSPTPMIGAFYRGKFITGSNFYTEDYMDEVDYSELAITTVINMLSPRAFTTTLDDLKTVG